MTSPGGEPGRGSGDMGRWPVIAGIALVAMSVVYVVIIHAQGDGDGTLRPAFVGGLIAGCGVMALLAPLLPLTTVRSAVIAFAGAAVLLLGVLAIFSIGLALLVISIPLFIALARSGGTARARVLWCGFGACFGGSATIAPNGRVISSSAC